MTDRIIVALDYQPAPAAWGSAKVSFEGNTARIHLGEGDLYRQVQAAARQITSQGIQAVTLEGEEWDPILQWRFACGFGTAKAMGDIQWASHAEQLQAQRDAQLWLKDLTNATPEALSPEVLADEVAERLSGLAPEHITSRQIVGDALLAAGWVGVHGVGRGSDRPPVMLELDYNPTGDHDAPVSVALVGKGITFDSGGYSIKPSAGMVSMKCDMGGAATVAAALKLAISRGLDKRVKLFLCCAENLISGHAYKLGDILHYKNGTSVEIVNTDAEGRLVLADGLIAANEAGAERIINAATLTGAAAVALGDDYNALFSLDDEAAEDALDAAAEVDEGLWRLPLEPFHAEKCPSPFADTANSRAVKGGGTGGASNAAGFLSRFAGTPPKGWLHFDLAGAYADSDNGQHATGATGMGMLTIANLLLKA
ncbi:aminopeptidase PepB [Ferrimonas balearica]|uniref:aminopeptidase PepB n=1 Tax=Ferrimonas balearica TaxID=44012 RepID=UPI001C98E709|nr:aminopeptidase PepB [Ferrimonas balearica]MBY5921550.1 aminopeptidase PepB [Ferrimonas balearica]MBY5995110.1 aminopeptidase PepB [Ferrimonas balearica]